MKKVALSLAGVLAAVAFAPEAAAVPAFARQTGMACSACHSQHFPILNGFGRAFKAGGFTMMGGQEKVEGEHMSIPAVLNASIVMKLRYQKDNTTAPAGAGTTSLQTKGSGELQFFDEFALLMGGRVAENVGFLLEGQMIETAPFAASFKMPFVFDVGAAKLSVIPFLTDGLDAAYGYELSSGGVVRNVRWSEHRKETSAVQYNTTKDVSGPATGVAFVAQNDMGYINVSRYAPVQGGGSDLKSTYARIAVTPTIGDWAIVAGVGNMSGSSFDGGTLGEVGTEQTFADFQAQGEVGGMEAGVYAQYATAPVNATLGNIYNSGSVTDRKAFTIGADFTVIPHTLSLGAAYRKGENGGAAASNGDDALTVQAVYDMYQNVALHAIYSNYSGSYYDANSTKATNLLTLMLESAF